MRNQKSDICIRFCFSFHIFFRTHTCGDTRAIRRCWYYKWIQDTLNFALKYEDERCRYAAHKDIFLLENFLAFRSPTPKERKRKAKLDTKLFVRKKKFHFFNVLREASISFNSMLFTSLFSRQTVHRKTILFFTSSASKATRWEFARRSIRWLRKDESETFRSCQHITRYIKSRA